MRAPPAVLVGILSIGFLVAPLAGEAQPTLEQFRFDPPRLCFRDTFRWGFSSPVRPAHGRLSSVSRCERTAEVK